MAALVSHGAEEESELMDSILARHGTQGIMDTVSKGQMEEHFGTSKEEEVIKDILEHGDVQESEVSPPQPREAWTVPVLSLLSL